MSEFSILFRNAVKAVAAAALVLSVAACGVKSSPAQPSGHGFPRQHPTPGAKTVIPTAETEQTGKDKSLGAQDRSGAPRSPLGFPLEYPNRPTY